MTKLNGVKDLLMIERDDTTHDRLLKKLYDDTSALFKIRYSVSSVDPNLTFVVDKVTVKAFRRFKAENMKQRKIDTKTEIFHDPADDFKEFDGPVNDFYNRKSGCGKDDGDGFIGVVAW